ncbi:hypothetical protein BKA63DRAFT_605774 [Paraphoma chrysanthemicola]|nr:hypothetical protein BKA63DRAFT_605774 [Paraphoma chrysanthemicola]
MQDFSDQTTFPDVDLNNKICHWKKNLAVIADHSRLGNTSKDRPATPFRNRRWTIDCRTVHWAGQYDPPSWTKWKHTSDLDSDFCTNLHNAWCVPSSSINLPMGDQLPDPKRYTYLDRSDFYSPPNDDALYLDLPQSTLHNRDFHNLLKTADGDGWYSDNTIGTSLETLKNITESEKHNITILPPGQVLPLARLGATEDPDTEYAYGPGKSKAETWSQFEDISAAIKDKAFIFMPLSNSYRRNTDDYLYEAGHDQLAGSHWTLLVLDCRGPVIQAMHFNSKPELDMANVEQYCYRGAWFLLRQLGMTIEAPPSGDDQWKPRQANNVPHQGRDNAARDAGGCGPFVWWMAKELIQYIADWTEEAGASLVEPATAIFDLPLGYPEKAEFNSAHVRRCVMALCARERRILARRIDEAALD